MNVAQLLVGLSAAAFVGGMALAWSGWHPRERVAAVAPRRSAVPLVSAMIAGLIVFAVSGWMVPALVVAGLAGWAALRLSRRDGDEQLAVARVEALASWVENVRDVLQAAGQPIGALSVTAESCPAVIRPEVRTLSARLAAGQPADVVFRRFADEIDDPLADLVAVGLLIAVSRGAQTDHVLSSLADQARHQADRRRVVEAERAPMRHQVMMVSIIMCALLGAVFVFARSSFLDAYDDLSGQVFLALVLCGYAALLLRVAALSRFPRPSRFLSLRGGEQ
jgi:Flp pilus assembly protein TadB